MKSNVVIRTFCPAAALLLLPATLSFAQISFHTIAVTGDPAPGMGGLTFAWLSGPRLNDGGIVAFAADLAGAGVTEESDGSLWTDRSGALELVARNGQPAPGSEKSLFSNLPFARLDADGNLAFTASLIDPGVSKPTELGLYAESSPGAIALIARDGLSPLEGQTISTGSLSADGWSAFLTSGGDAVWSDRGGILTLRAALSDPAPGAPEGQAFACLGEPTQTSAGDLVFRSSFAAEPDDQPAGYGIWTEIDGVVSPVVLTGDAVPGAGPDVVFAELAAAPASGIAARGATIFWARVEGPDIEPDSDSGIFAATPSGLVTLMRENTPAPLLGGPLLDSFSRTINQTEDGSGFLVVYLRGEGVTESSNSVLYRLAAGAVAGVVAREGDPAPGTPGGVLFAQFPDVEAGPEGHGAGVFRLRGDGVDKTNNLALYLVGKTGALELALRTGDSFDLRGDGSDLRTVIDILIDAGAPGSGDQSVAPDGAAAFKLDFADRSHALVIAAPATPVCKPDCNKDDKLNINDFICFQAKWRSRDAYGDYDASGTYTINDFIRFQADFVKGCK